MHLPSARPLGLGSRYVLHLAGLLFLYIITAQIGLRMDAVGGFASLVWPPTGVALAALILYGMRLWPAVALGAFIVNLAAGAHAPVALGIAVGNSLESVVAVYLLRRWDFQPKLSRTQDALVLIVLAAFLSTTISASIGTISLYLGGMTLMSEMPNTWGAWWAGDVLGAMIVAPLLMVWSSQGRPESSWRVLSNGRLLELGLFISTMLFGAVIHLTSPGMATLGSIPRAYTIFPLLIWTALRFGVRTTVTTVFMTSVFAVILTSHGIGPFVRGSLRESLANLHFFIGTTAVTALILVSAVAERVHKNRLVQEMGDRAKAELQLKQSEQRYRHLIDAVADYAIYILDSSGRFASWNPGAEHMKGYTAQEVLGRHFSLLYPDAAIAAGVPEQHLAQAKAVGRLENEGWKVRKNGERFWAQAIITAMSDDAGNICGYSNITRDLTKELRIADALEEQNQKLKAQAEELHQQDQELRRAKTEAEAANVAKSVFLANMSHEIRTPLAVILGFSELMSDALPQTPEKQQWIGVIKRNTEALSNIINDILDLSKIEAGTLAVDRRTILLSEVISDLSLTFEPKAQAKGVNLVIDLASQLPQVIYTDPTRLRQILVNIVGNAVKFTAQGTVRVSIQLQRFITQKRILRFVVEDTGPGIPPESWKLLFQPFAQVASPATQKVGGTGLGLALARKLAHSLGGDVRLTESVPGVGSTFTIFIDIGPEPVPAAFAPTPPPRPEALPPPGLHAASRTKILLAEDHEDIRMMIEHQLEAIGVDSISVTNGLEVLERIKDEDFDIILMDLQMPVMDGQTATSELRRRGYRKPIVAMTAYAMKDDRDRCLGSGFDAHLSKPLNRDDLARAIFKFQFNSRIPAERLTGATRESEV